MEPYSYIHELNEVRDGLGLIIMKIGQKLFISLL